MIDIPFWVAIPVVALFIPITAIIADAYRNVKDKEHAHRERLKAMETGIGDPAALFPHPEAKVREKARNKGRGAAYHGAIWSGLGLGLLISTTIIGQTGKEDLRTFAGFLMIWAVPMLTVGLSLVAYGIFSRNRNGKDTSV